MSTRFSVQQIKYELLAYMKEVDTNFGHWTVGISHDPKKEMAGLHRIDMKNDPWIFKPALSEVAASNTCKYFTDILGCRAAQQSSGKEMKYFVFALRIDPSN